MKKTTDFSIKTLGTPEIQSPLVERTQKKQQFSHFCFVPDNRRVLHSIVFNEGDNAPLNQRESLEMAGPREKIFFNPSKVKIAIVTCGGISPGLNDVIRSIVMESYYQYGVRHIYGIPYGYNGLNPASGHERIVLTPEDVHDIHMDGGTLLGSSRGGTENMDILVDTLEKWKINILYTIGGDGTLKGAHQIAEIARDRGLQLSVVGIPKTIDNDISYIQKSFGFETAFSVAVGAITSAHVEAKGAPNGIGLVKLMGRHSGFIAANAALAMNDVNYVLVPEVPFELDGNNGFLQHLEQRIHDRGHAVICVAEGAGQDLLRRESDEVKKDKSGNIALMDVGPFMKKKIEDYFQSRRVEINLKYIDPSYMIRSSPAVPTDSIYCALLGQYAVHAGMSGKTDLIVGQWNNIYVHIPIEMAISKRKRINPESRFWQSVLEATGQPPFYDENSTHEPKEATYDHQ